MPRPKKSTSVVVATSTELVPLFSRALEMVRDDARDNPYLTEALRVLPVGGYRSAIGSVWNAVADDLRNKILHRSVELFNKSLSLPRRVEFYEVYKVELANRLFSAYIHAGSSSILRSNIEFTAPVLWTVLSTDVKSQIVRRLDREITAGNAAKTSLAFDFVNKVGGQRFLSATARKYKLAPLIEKLKNSLDDWKAENAYVLELEPYAAFIPDDLLEDYVSALVRTYIGYTGASYMYSRTDFYANGAALRIPKMFQAFEDKAAAAFVAAIRGNSLLRRRITNPVKLNRLRNLGNIVLEKVSAKFSDRAFLESLVNPETEKQFITHLDKHS